MIDRDSLRTARLQTYPWFKTEPKRRQTRRAYGHDYKAPGVYMITMTARHGRPALSAISEAADGSPLVSLTVLGTRVDKEIRELSVYHPRLEVRKYVVMPDHIHLLLWVKERLDRDLGQVLAGFKGACSKHLLEFFAATGSAAGAEAVENRLDSFFMDGFHDRIIRDSAHYDTCARYIADNPRRLLIRRKHPDLFRRYNRLMVAGRKYAAYGNVFLLRNFDKRCVMVHRADTAADKERQRAEWLWCATNGGVLVSPFISKEEKSVREEALSVGGCVIALRHDGFPERFKPSAAEFALCAEGRLLLLAPWPENLAAVPLTRAVSLRLNALAAEIATLPYSAPVSLR